MGLTFYYAPMSTASVTEAVLAELGIACDRVKLDIDAGDTRKREFLEINPNGQVPVIIHDETVIWESAAITIYLGETFGVEPGLFPAPGVRRGEAMKWIVWSNVALAEAAGRLAAALPVGSDGAVQAGVADRVSEEMRSASALGRARADITNCLRVLDAGLEERDFLLGDYSLADTHVHGFVGWLALMGFDLAPFSHIDRWMQRCFQRPALAQLAEG